MLTFNKHDIYAGNLGTQQFYTHINIFTIATPRPFFWKIHLFLFDGQSKRGRKQWDLPPADSFLKWLQHSGVGQPEAKSFTRTHIHTCIYSIHFYIQTYIFVCDIHTQCYIPIYMYMCKNIAMYKYGKW